MLAEIILGLFLFVAVVAVFSQPLGYIVLRDRLIELRWRLMAVRLGLDFRSGAWVGSDRMLGDIADCQLLISNGERHDTKIELVSPVAKAPDFLVFGRGWHQRPKDARWLSLDPKLDACTKIYGPSAALRSRLDAPTRALMMTVLETTQPRFSCRLEVREGRLSYLADGVIVEAGLIERLTEQLGQLALRLDLGPDDEPCQLCEISGDEDELDLVRAAALEVLAFDYSNTGEAERALREALLSPTAYIRFCAARALGTAPRATAVLVGLAIYEAEPEEVRVAAIERLLELDLQKDFRVVCQVALRSSNARVRQAVAPRLQLLPESVRQPAALGLLEDGDTRTVVACVDGLDKAFRGAPDIQSRLIELLGSDVQDVRRAAARALGRTGSIEAVAALLPLARGLSLDLKLKRIAAQAIDVIRGQLSREERGQLSVIEQKLGGDLSISEDGNLSHPEQKNRVALENVPERDDA